MKNMASTVVKQIREKGDAATETDLAMMDLFQNGGDCVQEEQLEPIVRWFAEEPHTGVLKAAVNVEI